MSELITRLRNLDTCAVSDALDRHDIPGAIGGLRSLAADRVVAGRAVTVQLGPPADNAVRPPRRHLGATAVDASGPDDVIVVAHQGRLDCAGWGGLLSRAAAQRGIEGVIIDGAVRDLAEARDAGLSIHARATTPITARGRAVEHQWGITVELAGVLVVSGDFVLADVNGVVIIPQHRAHEVLATAEQIAATEAAMARAIEDGTPVSEVMGQAYEEMTTREK
jgi:4-hydroxy-4-methyl-2-oxoglutarate aldolase